jgi:DNA (cytosine-5)-methyltransferase 1
MRLLDLFCGAGGAAMGYHKAGFDEIVGVDNRTQPRYPFAFVLGDALEYCAAHGHEFDAIHASPPCQGYSVLTNGVWKNRVSSHPKMIDIVRELIQGKPYVIENVSGARAILKNPLMLCGSMFGLEVFRHRYFETTHSLFAPCSCRHDYFAVPVYGHSGAGANRNRERQRGRTNSVKDWARAMGIDWMTGSELAQAIPPAYTRYIGEHLLRFIKT